MIKIRITGRQNIKTAYMPPVGARGSRIKATASGGQSLTVPWDSELDTVPNHEQACRRLVAKLGWQGEWKGGDNGTGFVFVNLSMV